VGLYEKEASEDLGWWHLEKLRNLVQGSKPKISLCVHWRFIRSQLKPDHRRIPHTSDTGNGLISILFPVPLNNHDFKRELFSPF
jgi:hypothetical protein